MERTYIHLAMKKEDELPAMFAGEDVRFPIALAEHFIARYTGDGDLVFDPFAGYGTTLITAERMGRVGFGVEFDEDRARYIRERIAKPEHIMHGDSLRLDQYPIPAIDFSLTSPPYMTKTDHPQYPFAGYRVTGADYAQYLRDIASIYRKMRSFMKPNARAVIEISNLSMEDGSITPLAWDVAAAISEVLVMEKEVIVCWDEAEPGDQPAYGFGYDHSYCLVFRNCG